MATVIIRGSWGHLTVDRATGVVLSYDDEGNIDGFNDADETGYRDIAFFLPETLALGRDSCLDRHGETDILGVGYVTTSGVVVPPMQQVEDEHGFAIHTDLAALPAPRWRPIEDDDVASATRGLSMRRLSDDALALTKARHMLVDMFASAVIVMAVTAEQRRRA